MEVKIIITIAIINGPNINMLGMRQPEIYGQMGWKEIEEKIIETFHNDDVVLEFYQDNCEGSIINYIQENYSKWDGIVINPASLTINGYGLLECLIAVNIPFIEVHMSNIFFFCFWHAKSIFSKNSVAVIVGLKEKVYQYGVKGLIDYLK